MNTKLDIFTAGVLVENGFGGWAALIVSGEAPLREPHASRRRTLLGNDHHTTWRKMELEAAIEGLATFRSARDINLYSFSTHLVSGFSEGKVEQWAANHWRTDSGKNWILNHEQWQNLNEKDLWHRITYHLVDRGSPSLPPKVEFHAEEAYTLALSAARLAAVANGRRIEGYPMPQTAEGLQSLTGLIQELPDTPDAPTVERPTTYGVYQRSGSLMNPKLIGPVFRPVDASKATDRQGDLDGGKWRCQMAARTMNRSDDTKEGVKFRTHGKARYVVLPVKPEYKAPGNVGERAQEESEVSGLRTV